MTGEHGKVNGLVSWKSMVWTITVVFGISGAVAAYALNQHASFPHAGATTKEEYYNDIRDLKDDIKEIKHILRSK